MVATSHFGGLFAKINRHVKPMSQTQIATNNLFKRLWIALLVCKKAFEESCIIYTPCVYVLLNYTRSRQRQKKCM